MTDVSEIIAKMAPPDQDKAWHDFLMFGNMFAQENADGTYRYIDIRTVHIEDADLAAAVTTHCSTTSR